MNTWYIGQHSAPSFHSPNTVKRGGEQYTAARVGELARPTDPRLRVPFGQTTFDAEGIETPGKYFSRSIHWAGSSSSGVTVGRGYDMGSRTRHQVFSDLLRARVPREDAELLAQGAGKTGDEARAFVQRHRENYPVISLEAQQRLFEVVTTPDYINDIKRIFTKPDVVEKYGRADWDSLPPHVREFVFDLRYRGDYTPRVRRELQALLAAGDEAGVSALAKDTKYWQQRGVPLARIESRKRLFE